MGPNPVTYVFIRRGKFRHRHMVDHCAKTDTETGVLLPHTKAYQGMLAKARKDQERLFPGVFGRRMARPTTRFWIFSLHNDEIVNFCCFKPPSLWYFVMGLMLQVR